MLQPTDQAQQKEKPVAPQQHRLRSGNLECIYENGSVRYISSDGSELVRSVYPAVRDEFWSTPPVTISGETIEQLKDGFRIGYRANYALNDIRYTAAIGISGTGGNELNITFDGSSDSEFLRNRIGLCALLPPALLRGKPCVVGNPEGERKILLFPENISPVQPFVNFRSLDWEAGGGIRVRMECSGDIFEMEDQRNWGDASFKIYSTPHHLPTPVAVRKGDRVRQEIKFRFEKLNGDNESKAPAHAPVVFHTGNPAFPFPGIGYCYNPDAQTPDGETIRLLRRLSADHYRIELFIPGNWEKTWENGCNVAKQLETKLHVVIFATDGNPEASINEFLPVADTMPDLVSAMLVFSGIEPVTGESVIKKLTPVIHSRFPGIRLGSGSDTFFADWNQQPAIPETTGAFIALPVNPQVHLSDSTTMVENLPAMSDIIETAQFHSPKTAVYISPLTLKIRYNPDALASLGVSARFPYGTDQRQQSLLGAAWTAVAIRYLCRAEKITLFEVTGERGLLPAVSPEAGLAAVRSFPVYLLLREIAAFKPKRILLSRSMRPTEVDGLVMENTHGDRLMIFCNFSRTRQTLQLKTETWKTQALFGKMIAGNSVTDLLEDGEKFRSTPYNPFSLSEGNSCRLPAGGVLFLTTLQDWSFS